MIDNLSLLGLAPMLNLQLLLDGLLIGSIFAIAAYGLALVWGVMNVKNLAQGDIVYVGTGSTVEGDLVMMHSAGTWTSAQANDVRSGTTMLGIALGTDPDVDGVLLRGTYTLDHDVGINVGVPLYLSDGTAGQATTTIPDSSGDIVRVIGYTLANDDEIWFDPDKTWVELS